MKTLSRLIALSLSVMASTAAFSQAPVVGGSTSANPSGVKFNVAGSKITSTMSTLPSKEITPVTSPAQNRIPFRKFDQNHPVFDQFAKNHPQFADRVFRDREQMRDKGMTVKEAKDRFQRRVERNQDHAAKVQALQAERQKELSNHPKFANFVQSHPKIAMQHRAHMIRSHK